MTVHPIEDRSVPSEVAGLNTALITPVGVLREALPADVLLASLEDQDLHQFPLWHTCQERRLQTRVEDTSDVIGITAERLDNDWV